MKNIFLGCLVLFVVVTLSACQKTEEQKVQLEDSANQKMVEEKKDEGGMFSGSLGDLMHMGSAQKCTWTEDGKPMGVAFVDGERVRTDAENVITGEEGVNGSMSMINDGEWIYTWDDVTKEGMKVRNQEIEDSMMDDDMMDDGMTDMEDSEELVTVMDDMVYDYSCEKWKVDEKQFMPPSDVVFTDMDVMMQEMEDMIGGGDPCGALPEADREACRASMKDMPMPGAAQ